MCLLNDFNILLAENVKQEYLWVIAGALRNGLKWLEWAKVCLIAHPMQYYIRNMIGTSFLCRGLIISKLRILDSPLPKLGFQSKARLTPGRSRSPFVLCVFLLGQIQRPCMDK